MDKIIYYRDELNDEFSEAKIEPRLIDEKYKYEHSNIIWNTISSLLKIVVIPIKTFYPKIKFRIEYVGKGKVKQYKKQGYFVYGNHTQPFADTFITTNMIFPKKNFFIVNPENVSMKILGNTVQMLGAIPIPSNKGGMKKFLESIKHKIEKGATITIFPEAHIWPYYTKIRPFKDTSFRYPIEFNSPTFCITNTYHKRGKNKVKIITYLDGPFFPDENLKTLKEKKENLRNKVYKQMIKRSKLSDFEFIKYVKGE